MILNIYLKYVNNANLMLVILKVQTTQLSKVQQRVNLMTHMLTGTYIYTFQSLL